MATPIIRATGSLSGAGTAGVDKNVVEAETVTFDDTAPANVGASYVWTLTHQPIGSTATLSNPTSATPSLVPDATGTYRINCVVNGVAHSARLVAVLLPHTSTRIPHFQEEATWNGDSNDEGWHEALTYFMRQLDDVAGGSGGPGRNAGIKYTYSTNVASSDPGSGKLKFDSTTLSLITNLRISETDGDGNAISALLSTLDDSTTLTARSTVMIVKDSDPASIIVFQVSAALTDHGLWDDVNITYLLSSGTFLNGDTVKMFIAQTGDKGTTGDDGADGRAAGIKYTYSTDTANSDPGTGKLKFNTTTLASIATLRISETDGDSNAIAALLAMLGASTNTTKATVVMTKDGDPSVMLAFSVTSALTDNGTWDSCTVSYLSSSGSFANNDVVKLDFAYTGDIGPAVGAAGGQLGGTYPNPDVRGLRETTGPTNLTMAGVNDGELLKRSGSNIIGFPFPTVVLDPYAAFKPHKRWIGAGCFRTGGSGSEPWTADSASPTLQWGTFIFAYPEVAPYDATIDAARHYCDSAAPVFWIAIARNTTDWDGNPYPGTIVSLMSFNTGGLVGARLRGGTLSASVSKGELFWVLYQCDGLHSTFGHREGTAFRPLLGDIVPEIASSTVPYYHRGVIGWVTHRQLTYSTSITDFPSATAAQTIDTDTLDFDWSTVTAAAASLSGRLATTAALPACTAAGSGVGKTLTANANGVLTVDSVTVNLNDVVLVQNEATGADNGLYKCTQAGAVGAKFILTRSTSMDTTGAQTTPGVTINVTEGTIYNGQTFVLTGKAKMLGQGSLPLLSAGGNTIQRPSVFFRYA